MDADKAVAWNRTDRVDRPTDFARHTEMTASNPLHTDPAEIGRRASAHPAGRALRPAPSPAPSADDGGAPRWADLAAGRAVRDAQARAAAQARQVAELDLAARRRADADPAARRAESESAGAMYRTAYTVVLTVVVGFFASGAGLAIYVLVRH